jgi:hypothetical protein
MAIELTAKQAAREALLYCWDKRGLALRYGAIPFGLSLAASLAIEAVHPFGNTMIGGLKVGVVNIGLHILIAIPLTVTWYRLIVFGEAGLRLRSLYSFGRPEFRLLLWQLLLLIITMLPICIMGLVLFAAAMAAGGGGRGVQSFYALMAAFLVLGIALALLYCRLSFVLVQAATDQPAGFTASWRLSRGLGWKLLRAYTAISVVTIPVTLLSRAVPEFFRPVMNDIGTLVTLLGTTALFGMIYARLIGEEPGALAPMVLSE